jgi:iron-sulfur cluster assembly protein
MAILTLTDSAKQKIKELCLQSKKYAVRLGIKGGGCAGFSYDWGFAEKSEIDKQDELIEFTGGKLLVDSTSIMFLLGSELNFVSEVWGSHFDIKSPKVKSSCGCGESITFDMEKVNG